MSELVGPRGLEPRLNAPKALVLPLHHGPFSSKPNSSYPIKKILSTLDILGFGMLIYMYIPEEGFFNCQISLFKPKTKVKTLVLGQI